MRARRSVLDSAKNDEWSRYFRRPDLHGIEALHARFVRHRFSNHAHDYFVIGLVEEGTQTYRYRGARQTTPSGGVFLVNVGESHTGEPATEYGYVYRTLYPDSTLLRLVIGDLPTSKQTPYFTGAVLHDTKLFLMLQAFHRALGGNFPLIETETRLFSSLRLLLSRYSEFQNSKRQFPRESIIAHRAREYLEANSDRNVSLTELAEVVARDVFYLAHIFEWEVGLPPHAYLDSVRIRKSKQLLASGLSIASVAFAVGYADQSHFTHRFKRLLGTTPGQYQSRHKIRQDKNETTNDPPAIVHRRNINGASYSEAV